MSYDFKFGNVATVQVDNASGTLTDISGYLSSANMTFERDTTDLPRLGGHQVAQLVGPVSTSYEVEGWWEPDLDAIMGAWMLEATPTARSIAYGPQGSASGAAKYTAEVYLASYEPETPGDDAGTFSATFVTDANGTTRGTFT